MGESIGFAQELILSITGYSPQMEMNGDGTMSLHIGETVLTAKAALWSDPTAYLHANTLSISWAEQIIIIPLQEFT